MRNDLMYFLLAIHLFFWPTLGFAQSKQVKGTLYFEEDQQAIPFVHIYLYKHPSHKVQSDSKGEFQLSIPKFLAHRDSIRVVIELDTKHKPTGFISVAGNNTQLFIARPKYIDLPHSSIHQEIKSDPGNKQAIIGTLELIAKLQEKLKANKHISPSQYAEIRQFLNYLKSSVNGSYIAFSSQSLDDSHQPKEKSILRLNFEHQTNTYPEKSFQAGFTLSALSLSELSKAFHNLDEEFDLRQNKIIGQIKDIQKRLMNPLILSPSRIAKFRQDLNSLEKELASIRKNFWEKDASYRILIQKAQQEIDNLQDLLVEDSNFVRIHKTLYFGFVGFIIFISLFLILLTFLIQRLRKRKKELQASFGTIELQNQEIVTQNEELASQRDQLAHLNEKLKLTLEEIHHRVKNHLQRTSNLLDLSLTSGHGLKQIINDIRGRIYSMSLIHKKLQNTTRLDRVDLREYIQDLVSNISNTLQPLDKTITCHSSIEKLYLDISSATDIGLIVNELVTNAYKYAFIGLKEGDIRVIIHKAKQDFYELIVKDDGQGLPKDFELENVTTLGLSLTQGLAEGMNGNVKVHTSPGSTFIISFRPKSFIHRALI